MRGTTQAESTAGGRYSYRPEQFRRHRPEVARASLLVNQRSSLDAEGRRLRSLRSQSTDSERRPATPTSRHRCRETPRRYGTRSSDPMPNVPILLASSSFDPPMALCSASPSLSGNGPSFTTRSAGPWSRLFRASGQPRSSTVKPEPLVHRRRRRSERAPGKASVRLRRPCKTSANRVWISLISSSRISDDSGFEPDIDVGRAVFVGAFAIAISPISFSHTSPSDCLDGAEITSHLVVRGQ